MQRYSQWRLESAVASDLHRCVTVPAMSSSTAGADQMKLGPPWHGDPVPNANHCSAACQTPTSLWPNRSCSVCYSSNPRRSAPPKPTPRAERLSTTWSPTSPRQWHRDSSAPPIRSPPRWPYGRRCTESPHSGAPPRTSRPTSPTPSATSPRTQSSPGSPGSLMLDDHRRTATNITRFALDALPQIVRRSWSRVCLVAGEHLGPPVRLHFVESHGSPALRLLLGVPGRQARRQTAVPDRPRTASVSRTAHPG